MTDDPELEQSAVGTSIVPPTPGEVFTGLATGTSYVMGNIIGEGFFGVVYACSDGWDNDLAAKILKPIRTHDEPLADLFGIDNFNGPIWIVPIARCLLQAVNFCISIILRTKTFIRAMSLHRFHEMKCDQQSQERFSSNWVISE